MIRILNLVTFLIISISVNSQSEYIYILGNTQDAGLPHIGCQHPFCEDNFDVYEEYYTTSIAVVNSDLKKYILFEATPDITFQLNNLKKNIFHEFLLPESIYITHAHMGHYTGLMYFGREALGSKDLLVRVLPRMSKFLQNNGPWSQLVDINNIKIKEINFGLSTNELSNIIVTPVQVPHRDEYSETAGYIIEGKNKKALFIPDIDKWEKWDRNLSQLAEEFDFLLIDATFYDSKEINRDISEIPHPLVTETIDLLSGLHVENRSKVYFIHMNHTNMMLDPDSELSKLVTSKGFNIARLGQKLYL
ncbi:MAG: pyrroloquinoline quinone biosynthesis protein PqqB [Gammaproteobacteria bacterium]|nr:pyrroloquinoline quinone biosynthesis protein PqqB [Gammaproteobacteria bacterium]MBT5771396.1 pyrroloquinoline quinone biosynthesis protein PqqB [Flavobacteriaceae bacterium]MBT7753080.1 pyrroloquinoline quinone biosynthesis protein PqqB [Gammaproteobacteria bacterium]